MAPSLAQDLSVGPGRFCRLVRVSYRWPCGWGSDASAAAASKNRAVQGRHSVLLPDGTLAAGARPRMDEEFLLVALRWMTKSRLYDGSVIGLQRQGPFRRYPPRTRHA